MRSERGLVLAGRVLPNAAALAAALLALATVWRPITSLDLGYHLTYGDRFWETGRVVDDATFLAPPPRSDEDHGELPPGARFEPDGRYTFPNANWLSQALMSLAFRLGGAAGLEFLTLGLIAVILFAQAAAVRAGAGTWAWTGPVWLATVLTGYERFYLRPELIGNACLVGQLALVVRPLTRRRAIAFLALQLVAVNAHSYWILGAGLAAAAGLDAAVLTRRSLRQSATRRTRRGETNPRIAPAAALVAGSLALGLVHPAGLRNLLLPVQTLSYMHAHQIGGRTPDQVRALWQKGEYHPWQDTGELYRTLSRETMKMRSTRAFLVLLVLAPAAAVLLVRRGRPGLGLAAVALVLVALPVRRNLATAGFAVWPLVAIAAGVARAGGAGARSRSRAHPIAVGCGYAATIAGAVIALHGVVTNRFYLSEDLATRFGSGLSRAALPIGVCEWLDANLDRPQPVFANFNASSSVLFFSNKVTAVPILTNAWAYPPERKARLQRMLAGSGWIDPLAQEAGMDIAVLYALPSFRPFVSKLATSPDWALVHMEGAYLVFARRSPAQATLVAAHAIVPQAVDLPALVARARALDPKGAAGLRSTAGALGALGWDEQARAVLAAWKSPPR